MIRKNSSTYKMLGLVVLLGTLSSFLNTALAATACQNKNPPNDGNSHNYTCEKNTSSRRNYLDNTLCPKDNSTSSYPGFSCGSSDFVCHRCIPQKKEITCPEGQSEQNGACVCSDTKEAPVDGKCEKKSGPAIGSCGANGTLIEPEKTQCICPDKSIVALSVDCPKAATPPKTQTEEEKCKSKTGYQRNSVDQKCEDCKDPGVCCGVKLNTNVPFIGRCIVFGTDADSADTTVVTETTAFPRLIGALTKIMTTFLLLICFGGILVGGVMVAASGGDTKRASEGKSLIGKVIIAIAALGASGIILHLINPNFF